MGILFDIWTILGFLFGFLYLDNIYRNIKLVNWPKKVLIVFLLGPLWWVVMPLMFFVLWVFS